MELEQDVDYRRIALTAPQSVLDAALDLYSKVTQFGRITCIRYHNQGIGAKIWVTGETEPINIISPDDEQDRFKLGALLYVMFMQSGCKGHIQCNLPNGFSISTKHTDVHGSEFQTSLRKLKNGGLPAASPLEKAAEVKRYFIGALETDELGYRLVQTLNPDLKSKVMLLSKISNSNGEVSLSSAEKFLRDTNMSWEELYRLDEWTFINIGLDFTIEYKKIPFDKHMKTMDAWLEEKKDLEERIAYLEEELKNSK